MPPVCPRHGPSCPLSAGGKVCICCYFLPAIGALSGHWVLLEARVSLLAVPSHSSEVRRLGLYQPRWGAGFLFLPMALPSPEKNSRCHSRPRLCSQPVSHMAVWTPHKRLPLIFCEGMVLLCLVYTVPLPDSFLPGPLQGVSSLVSPCHLLQESSPHTSPPPAMLTGTFPPLGKEVRSLLCLQLLLVLNLAQQGHGKGLMGESVSV